MASGAKPTYALDAILDFISIDLLGCAMPRCKQRLYDPSLSMFHQPKASPADEQEDHVHARTQKTHNQLFRHYDA